MARKKTPAQDDSQAEPTHMFMVDCIVDGKGRVPAGTKCSAGEFDETVFGLMVEQQQVRPIEEVEAEAEDSQGGDSSGELDTEQQGAGSTLS